MNFEEFLNNRNGRRDTFAEGTKRAAAIQATLKNNFGLDVAVLRSDSPIKGEVGYVLVKIEGKVENIWQAIEFLLKNKFVTGQIIFVDGGASLKL